METQKNITKKGDTMRLGSYPCVVKEGTIMERCYFPDGMTFEKEISERHRHRYEFNNEYKNQLVKAGLVISGESPDGELVETVEVPDLPFFLGVQFHPEFKSRPNRPHPLFKEFIKTAISTKNK